MTLLGTFGVSICIHSSSIYISAKINEIPFLKIGNGEFLCSVRDAAYVADLSRRKGNVGRIWSLRMCLYTHIIYL